MSWQSRVVWSQGMFLQPQHFQQEARCTERLLDSRVRAAATFTWGFQKLVLDDAALALGKIAIAEAVGVLPDGTAFAIPSVDAAPAPFDVPADMKDESLLLALPMRRPGAPETDLSAMAESDGGDPMARYAVIELEARDGTAAADDEPATIQVGRLRLRLVRARDATGAYATLACARVQLRRPDNTVTLQRNWIAPQTTIAATPHLQSVATRIQGELAEKAQKLASTMGQLGHGVSEVAHFLMLQMFNRFEPVFAQHARLANVHPRELYNDCVALAGEFSTFVSAQRRPKTYPVYNHDDPLACFAPVLAELVDDFAIEPESLATQIPLTPRGANFHSAELTDADLLRTGAFVLAVNAQMPGEQLHARFGPQSTIGPTERIRDLVKLALPGIALRTRAVAPRELPYHAGFYYFDLERTGELWKLFEQSGKLAIHVAGEFPGLQMQLWAIRQRGA